MDQKRIERLIAERAGTDGRRLAEIVARRLAALREQASRGQGGALICVSLSVFVGLHRTCCPYAFTGSAHGTNNRLRRSATGKVFSDEDGREVLPFECLLAMSGATATPLNDYARTILSTENEPRWAYDEQGRLLVIRRARLARSDFDAPR